MYTTVALTTEETFPSEYFDDDSDGKETHYPGVCVCVCVCAHVCVRACMRVCVCVCGH